MAELRDASIYQLDLQIVGEVSVKSSSQAEKSYQTSKMQTDPEFKDHAETQTTISALTMTAASDKNEGTAPRSSIVPPASMDGLTYVYPGPHFDEARLFAFMSEALGDVVQIMQQNNRSKAFDHYEPDWSGRVESVGRCMTLTAPHTIEGEWHVSGMHWNTTGTTLAVAYGRIDTTGWCKQRGYVCCWNLSRREFDPDAPHQTIELDSYATSVAFHPTLASTLAIGTYSGEVALWSVSTGDDATQLMSCQGAKAPKEAVLRLQWLQNAQEQREAHRYVLCSASQDGKILFWSTSNKFVEPLAAYEIQNKKRFLVGVQAMSFMRSAAAVDGSRTSTPGLDNLMLLGVESGEVFRTKPGVTAAVRQGAAAGTASSVLEVDYYESHRGPVNALDCSPFFRNLFLTASSDGSVKLYSTLERAPLASIEPSVESRHYVYGAQFSPFRAAVLACVSRSGHLHIYDLEKTRTKPAFSAEIGTDGAPALALAFNPCAAKYLATGDGKGRVVLWNLSSELTQMTDLERSALRAEDAAVKQKPGASPGRDEHSSAADEKSDPVRQLFGFSL